MASVITFTRRSSRTEKPRELGFGQFNVEASTTVGRVLVLAAQWRLKTAMKRSSYGNVQSRSAILLLVRIGVIWIILREFVPQYASSQYKIIRLKITILPPAALTRQLSGRTTGV